MKIHRKASSKRKASPKSGKDALRFAPNFTVYVLPPDAVCLYSEDRKFFLHGELYCALASAIGQGGKSAQALLRELSKNFPSEKIEEAIKRLVDRRYVTTAPPGTDGTVAGYWATLGLPPEVAQENLARCRVRVEAFDVQGAKELTKSLSELGVRVVDRAPDLTITMVNDYLERRLAELNQQRVSNKTP